MSLKTFSEASPTSRIKTYQFWWLNVNEKSWSYGVDSFQYGRLKYVGLRGVLGNFW